jgi:hypothetical protein
MSEIRNRAVLHAVLLQTLQRYPEGIDLHDAYTEIERNYTFPNEWYRQIPAGTGYDELTDRGITDWRSIPQTRLVELVKTEPQWQNELRWARNDLRKQGLLDTSAPRGIWRLTSSGRASATRTLDGLTPPEREIATPKPKPDTLPKQVPQLAGTTIREGLHSKLLMLTSGMPIADLELLVEIARTIRQRTLEGDS